MQCFGRGGADIFEHLIINGTVGFDAPQVADSVLFEGSKQMQGAAASQPGADLKDDLWFLLRFQDGRGDNAPLLGI